MPSLAGKRWESTNENVDDGIGKSQQLQIKRARLRVEILKKESDPKAKYELFQRLNTGGAHLTPQEVRNCIAVMINPGFYDWFSNLSRNSDFIATTNQTPTALEQQMGVELVLRFLAFRKITYENGLDVHEYLGKALESLANDVNYHFADEEAIFVKTFKFLNDALGENSFKKWSPQNQSFSGKFLMSTFEVMAIGLSRNIEALEVMDEAARNNFITARAKELHLDPLFSANSGGGVRGTTRLANLLPMGANFFKP